MSHFNLVQREFRTPGKVPTAELVFTRSSKGSIELKSCQFDNSAQHFCAYLNSHIPDSWQSELDSLFKAEQELFHKRRALLASCRDQVPELFSHLPAEYKSTYPELFI